VWHRRPLPFFSLFPYSFSSALLLFFFAFFRFLPFIYSPFIPLGRIGPCKFYKEFEKRCGFHQQGLGQSPQPKSNFAQL